MKPPLVSHPVHNLKDVRRFFDGAAIAYRESHGPAARLLAYRVDILRRLLPENPGGLLVEIGCGPGDHLFALAKHFDRAVGLDLSQAMIERAAATALQHPLRERIAFVVDVAERLTTLDNATVDAVFCVGAFEHMLRKDAVVRQVRRVLKPGGTFACLTLNGTYVWYTRLAPWLGRETRHLTTDRYLTEPDLRRLLAGEGLLVERLDYWTFVPRGDMSWVLGRLLGVLDLLGRLLHIANLRGGICFKAVKP